MGKNKKQTPSRLRTAKKIRIEEAKFNVEKKKKLKIKKVFSKLKSILPAKV